MGIEIERKFLLRHDGWRAAVTRSTVFRQGYLASDEHCSVRVRVAGDEAHLNIKGGRLSIRRDEYEYAIPLADATALLDRLCLKPQIHKTRHLVPVGAHVWEIDEFWDENEGLVVAELELSDEHESYTRPDWLGDEVSLDVRYYNSSLVRHPFRDWK